MNWRLRCVEGGKKEGLGGTGWWPGGYVYDGSSSC